MTKMRTRVAEVKALLSRVEERFARLHNLLGAHKKVHADMPELEADFVRAEDTISAIDRKITKTLIDVERDALAAL